MDINSNTIEKTLLMFKRDKYGIYLTGALYNSSTNILFNHKAFNNQDRNRLNFANNLNLIHQDLWNIATIVERMAWTLNSRHQLPHLKERAYWYLSVDIEHFHLEIRSIMDYCAEAIAHGLGLSGELPSSFRKLKERSVKYQNKIPSDLLDVIKNTDWFSDIRKTRDLITHRGASAMVFHDGSEKILFQIHSQHFLPHINYKILMHDEDIVYFNFYAAYYISSLLDFLETIISLLTKDWNLEKDFSPIKSYSPGFEIIHSWCNDLLYMLNDSQELEGNPL